MCLTVGYLILKIESVINTRTSFKYSPEGGYFFCLSPATDGFPGHRARPPPVADKGSAIMAQRSKSLGAPSRKAILGTARGPLQVQILSPQP